MFRFWFVGGVGEVVPDVGGWYARGAVGGVGGGGRVVGVAPALDWGPGFPGRSLAVCIAGHRGLRNLRKHRTRRVW